MRTMLDGMETDKMGVTMDWTWSGQDTIGEEVPCPDRMPFDELSERRIP